MCDDIENWFQFYELFNWNQFNVIGDSRFGPAREREIKLALNLIKPFKETDIDSVI